MATIIHISETVDMFMDGLMTFNETVRTIQSLIGCDRPEAIKVIVALAHC